MPPSPPLPPSPHTGALPCHTAGSETRPVYHRGLREHAATGEEMVGVPSPQIPLSLLFLFDTVPAARPPPWFPFIYLRPPAQALLDIPRLGTLNIHPSLLPRYRGAAPVQRAVQDGVTETVSQRPGGEGGLVYIWQRLAPYICTSRTPLLCMRPRRRLVSLVSPLACPGVWGILLGCN